MNSASRRLKIGFGILSSLLLIFIILPLATTLFATTPEDFNQTLNDPELISSLTLTFGAAAIATVLAMISGVPLAYLLARTRFTGKRLIEGIINLPIVIPHTAAGIALLMVFGSKGVLGQFFSFFGIVFVDRLPGIVVAMMFVSLPYLVNMSREAFISIDPEMERAALIDGASSFQAFWLVTLPQAWRGIASGAMMMWARGMSEFGAVVILAYHPRIVPTLIYERFNGYGLASARPIALILILAALLVFGILQLLLMPEKEYSDR